MDKIEELLTRGVANIIPSKDTLSKLISSGKKLNIYLGIDPTATKIHLGHAVPLRKLQKFSELGHNVTFLIGDFTALIGDTSDKDSERPVLTSTQIEENFKTYKKQAEKILDFSKVKIRYNSEWLAKLTYGKLLKLKRQFSLNDFISRELIRKRLDEGKSVRLDETEYPIMQGYDSYFMDTDVQLGGYDQTFNMQAGRTLQKDLCQKESYILTNVFLPGTDGHKMSKSLGNTIWLDENPNDMYIKIMSIRDSLIVDYFILATNLSINEIKNIESRLESEKNPLVHKKTLAYQVVSEIHGKKVAKEAEEFFEKTVQQKQIPEDLPVFDTRNIPIFNQPTPTTTIVKPAMSSLGTVTDALIHSSLVLSRSEAKRAIEQGGVGYDGNIIKDPNKTFIPKNDAILRVGKRKFVKIKSAP